MRGAMKICFFPLFVFVLASEVENPRVPLSVVAENERKQHIFSVAAPLPASSMDSVLMHPQLGGLIGRYLPLNIYCPITQKARSEAALVYGRNCSFSSGNNTPRGQSLHCASGGGSFDGMDSSSPLSGDVLNSPPGHSPSSRLGRRGSGGLSDDGRGGNSFVAGTPGHRPMEESDPYTATLLSLRLVCRNMLSVVAQVVIDALSGALERDAGAVLTLRGDGGMVTVKQIGWCIDQCVATGAHQSLEKLPVEEFFMPFLLLTVTNHDHSLRYEFATRVMESLLQGARGAAPVALLWPKACPIFRLLEHWSETYAPQDADDKDTAEQTKTMINEGHHQEVPTAATLQLADAQKVENDGSVNASYRTDEASPPPPMSTATTSTSGGTVVLPYANGASDDTGTSRRGVSPLYFLHESPNDRGPSSLFRTEATRKISSPVSCSSLGDHPPAHPLNEFPRPAHGDPCRSCDSDPQALRANAQYYCSGEDLLALAEAQSTSPPSATAAVHTPSPGATRAFEGAIRTMKAQYHLLSTAEPTLAMEDLLVDLETYEHWLDQTYIQQPEAEYALSTAHSPSGRLPRTNSCSADAVDESMVTDEELALRQSQSKSLSQQQIQNVLVADGSEDEENEDSQEDALMAREESSASALFLKHVKSNSHIGVAPPLLVPFALSIATAADLESRSAVIREALERTRGRCHLYIYNDDISQCLRTVPKETKNLVLHSSSGVPQQAKPKYSLAPPKPGDELTIDCEAQLQLLCLASMPTLRSVYFRFTTTNCIALIDLDMFEDVFWCTNSRDKVRAVHSNLMQVRRALSVLEAEPLSAVAEAAQQELEKEFGSAKPTGWHTLRAPWQSL